jgi:hypothetical protein
MPLNQSAVRLVIALTDLVDQLLIRQMFHRFTAFVIRSA